MFWPAEAHIKMNMHLIPTNEEVLAMLRQTGALRQGHFEYANGMHTDEFVQVALAFRYFEWAKILSVGLSSRLRGDPEIRAMIKELSIVCPTTGGLPIAYGVCEALRAHQVYWAEKDTEDAPLHFRQFVEPGPGEKILLVDDILRSGRRFTELKNLVEAKGARSGRTCGCRLPAESRPSPISAIFRSFTWRRWTPCTTAVRTLAICASRGVPSKRSGPDSANT